MKVSIMSWYHYRNYGTALQVAALSQTVHDMGYEVDVIDYIPFGSYRTIADYRVEAVFDRVKSRFHKEAIPNWQTGTHFCDEEKEKSFEEFLHNHLNMTTKCENMNDLEKLNQEYEAFICGSDQIWAPSCFDSHYFLDFVLDKRRTVSYAPSIGLPVIEDYYVCNQMAELIDKINYLSIREAEGAEIIKKITGRSAKVVCDPTLLLTKTQWEEKAKKSKIKVSDNYMLVYLLGNNPKTWERIIDFSREMNLPIKIIPVFEQDTSREGCIKQAIGPYEFLELIRNASYVCTDSFHGTIFSCIFHKQFTVFERFLNEDPKNQNSRIHNLLRTLGLESRLFQERNNSQSECDIDFEKVDERITRERNSSVQYLSDSLQEIEKLNKTEYKNHVLVNNTLCCGCGACEAVCPAFAIQIQKDRNGFLSAFIDDKKCISCGKCVKVCPNEQTVKSVSLEDAVLYSYKSDSIDTLMKSSSGGAAFDLSRLLIAQGFTVIGCCFDQETQEAKHIVVNDTNDLKLLQGSKYLQSEFGTAIKKAMDIKTPIAVVGTPCQVAAAKALFGNRNNVVYIDLICHGVPSFNLYLRYKEHLSSAYQMDTDKMNISFRFKPKGWREIYIYTSNHAEEHCFHQEEDLFFRMFEAGNCYMKPCYDCNWRDKSAADIRLGDYWHKKFENDATGVSMMVALTESGQEIISQLKQGCCGSVEKQPMTDYYACQQTKNLPCPVYYDELQQALHTKNLNDIVLRYDRSPKGMSKTKYLLKMIAFSESIRYRRTKKEF
jgi:coenzyme F420-reducing hydrogenase beta subunit